MREKLLVALTYLETGATITLIVVPAVRAIVSALDAGKAAAGLIMQGECQ